MGSRSGTYNFAKGGVCAECAEYSVLQQASERNPQAVFLFPFTVQARAPAFDIKFKFSNMA